MLSESYTSFCVAVTCFSAIHSRQAHSISTPLNFRLRLQQLDCNPEHGALTLLLQNGALTLCTDRSRRQAVHMELRAILVIAHGVSERRACKVSDTFEFSETVSHAAHM